VINIISRAISRPNAGAVHKVALNLIKSLSEANQEYVVNKKIDYCSKSIILDDYRALLSLPKKNIGLKPILGPNLFVLPRDIPFCISIPDYALYVHPSDSAVNAWKACGYKSCRIDSWPVGIDTSALPPSIKRDQVMVYYKCREVGERKLLQTIIDALNSKGISYTYFEYGNYKQQHYLDSLAKTKYVIWLGRQESQGLALQESLAMNVPVLVCDVSTLGEDDQSGYIWTSKEALISATSAPYFSEKCGIKIRGVNNLSAEIDKMQVMWPKFNPIEYVNKHLSLDASLKRLNVLYEKWWDYQDNEITDNCENIKFKPYWPAVAIELRLRTRYKRILKKWL
jgi:hypothetical protein